MPRKITDKPTEKPTTDMTFTQLTALYNAYAAYGRSIGLSLNDKKPGSMFATKEDGVRIITERLINPIDLREKVGVEAEVTPVKAKRARAKAEGKPTGTPRKGRRSRSAPAEAHA